MRRFNQITGISPFIYIEYNLKCLVGVTVGWLLYKMFPQYAGQFLWLLLSILLSITHDNSSKVAHDRMKGNIAGSTVGLATFFIHNPPNLLTIGAGVVVAITICCLLNLVSVARTAIVAFIIVVIYEEAENAWQSAVYRMASVIVGCLIGLIINYVFRKAAIALGNQAPGQYTESDATERGSE